MRPILTLRQYTHDLIVHSHDHAQLVFGLSGASDLLVRIVAVDADDLYRIAGLLLDIPGVERTNMAIAMRELVTYRLTPVLERAAGTA